MVIQYLYLPAPLCYNDNYGHDIGDIVLQSIAQTVLSCVRKTDAVIRYGGDEFVIIFFGIPQEIFEKKLERIKHSVDGLIIDGHPELHMSVSIGGAYGSGTAKKLFKVADNMMYQSKKSGDYLFSERDIGQRRQHLRRRICDYESKRLLYKIRRRF